MVFEKKRCPKCGQAKPLDGFYRNKNAVDGRDGWCKACRNAYHKKRAARSSNEIAAVASSHKTCTTCRKQKPIVEFYRDQRQTDGRETRCRDCKNQERRERNWKEHPGRAPAPDGLRRCHVCGEAKPLGEFWWKWKAKGHRSQICADCAKASKAQQDRSWYQAHKDKAYAAKQRRRANKASVPCALTEQQWQATLGVFGWCCAYCQRLLEEADTVHRDHVVPLSAGGGYVMANIVGTCPKCNFSKGIKPYREWMASKGHNVALFEHKLSNLEWLASEPT